MQTLEKSSRMRNPELRKMNMEYILLYVDITCEVNNKQIAVCWVSGIATPNIQTLISVKQE